MQLERFFDNASAFMTLVSFLTFMGIVWWSYIANKPSDFDQAANLPFADDAAEDSHV